VRWRRNMDSAAQHTHLGAAQLVLLFVTHEHALALLVAVGLLQLSGSGPLSACSTPAADSITARTSRHHRWCSSAFSSATFSRSALMQSRKNCNAAHRRCEGSDALASAQPPARLRARSRVTAREGAVHRAGARRQARTTMGSVRAAAGERRAAASHARSATASADTQSRRARTG